MGSRNARAKRKLRSNCQKKIRYASHTEAQVAAKVSSHTFKSGLGFYKCTNLNCNGYHVGHTPTRIRRIILQRKGL